MTLSIKALFQHACADVYIHVCLLVLLGLNYIITIIIIVYMIFCSVVTLMFRSNMCYCLLLMKLQLVESNVAKYR